MGQLLLIPLLCLILRHSLKCSKSARRYNPISLPSTMYVDTRSGELVFGEMSLSTARRIYYIDLLLMR